MTLGTILIILGLIAAVLRFFIVDYRLPVIAIILVGIGVLVGAITLPAT